MLESRGCPVTRETKEITIFNDVSSLFLFSLGIFCSPAWWYCTFVPHEWVAAKGLHSLLSLINSIVIHCIHYIYSLAKSLQLILEISATYRLVSYLLAGDWLICRLCMQCMISKSNVKLVLWDGVFVVIYFKTMYKNTIIVRFGFCDILNNQGPGVISLSLQLGW